MPVMGDSMDLLHCVEYDRVTTHSKIIITTPHVHFIFRIRRMRNRELDRETINIVEIPVTLIFVFLLQFLGVECCVVKMDWMGACSVIVGWRSGSVGGWRETSNWRGSVVTLALSEVGMGVDVSMGMGMRTHTRRRRSHFGRIIVLGSAVDGNAIGERSVAGDDLLIGTHKKCRTHSRTFGSFDHETREGRMFCGGGGGHHSKSLDVCC